MNDKPKIPLSSFQSWMQQMLLDPHGQTTVDAQKLLPDELYGKGIASVINDSKRLSAEEHLAIYQRSYIARLRGSMAKQFRALEYALGEDLFCGFADNYLENHPSSSYNLIDLGKHLANYLEESRPDANEAKKEDWPDFMIELAKFEYLVNILFDEKGGKGPVVTDQSISDDDLNLTSLCRLFQFRFPIRRYYSAFANDMEPGLPIPQKSYCIILRHNFRISMFDIHFEQYCFLQYLQSGHNISEAKNLLHINQGIKEAQIEAVWPTWKAKWIESNFFCKKI